MYDYALLVTEDPAGDVIGEGVDLMGEPLRLVPGSIFAARNFDEEDEYGVGSGRTMGSGSGREPVREFEVVRRLGKGSYAIVYLVREVLERREGFDDVDDEDDDEEDVLSDSGASASFRTTCRPCRCRSAS